MFLKTARFFLLGLPGALLLLTSCATSPKTAEGPKFYEASAANLVVRYSSESTIYRLKPDAHQGPFYQIFSRQQLCDADTQRAGRRDLAVVLVGRQWTPQLDQQVKQAWLDSLAKLNYRRVVILRSGDTDQVNGLRVLEDRQIVQVAPTTSEIGLASAHAPEFTVQ